MGRVWFLLYPWFIYLIFSLVTRPKLPLGQIISATSNHATYDAYWSKAIKTLADQKFYEFFIIYLQMYKLFIYKYIAFLCY